MHRRWFIPLLVMLAVGFVNAYRLKADDAESLARAKMLAKNIRDRMTDPAIMKIETGDRADTCPRGKRQREVAKADMHALISCGKAADEPLWTLLSDEEASVRRSVVILLEGTRTGADSKPIAPTTIRSLHIPMFERALNSKDDQVRYFACNALGNFASWSDDALERLYESLPKLRKLREDESKDVRVIAWTACNSIASALTSRSQSSMVRVEAGKELERLQREGAWK